MADKIVLTDRVLMALKPAPPGKRIIIWDAVQPHFGVRITESGARSFLVVQRLKGVRTPLFCMLGRYPGTTLAYARKRAQSVLSQIADGVDPKKWEGEEARAVALRRDESTFGAIAKLFIAEHASRNRSGFEAERIINVYLLPRFGRRQIADIKRREIAK
jgi:hypothetical protein